MLNTLIILLLIALQNTAKVLIPNDLKVTITSLKQCHSTVEYPVEVYNVIVNLDKGKIAVTGTLTTSVDLTPPIKAVLKVEKVELGIWIEIPCVNSIGSCTYDDLCIYSLPLNETCPESFISNNVPCRCPISKGNYSIPSSLEFEISPQSYFSVYSGNYWANIHLLNKHVDLSCYNIYFTIESSVNEKTKDFGADYNGFDVAYDDIPFVMLV